MKTVHANALERTHGIMVHGVNAQGRFNAGFAKQLAREHIKVYWDYMFAFHASKLELGRVIRTRITNDFWILSGVTQEFYGRDPNVVYVDYAAIEEVFQKASRFSLDKGLPLFFPKIGSGLAHGHWPTIEAIIERSVHPSVDVTLYDWTP